MLAETSTGSGNNGSGRDYKAPAGHKSGKIRIATGPGGTMADHYRRSRAMRRCTDYFILLRILEISSAVLTGLIM
jgi:hypothetical protein